MLRISTPIKRSQQFNEYIEKYKKENSVFSTIKDMMFFAAMLGYSQRSKWNKKEIDEIIEKFENEKNRPDIGHAEWNNDENITLIFALGIAEKKDSNILSEQSEKEMIRIFEKYSHLGFLIMKEYDKSFDPFSNIEDLFNAFNVFTSSFDSDEYTPDIKI